MFHMGEDGGFSSTWWSSWSKPCGCRLTIPAGIEPAPLDDTDPPTFPLRNGVTLLISQDPPDGGERDDPRIRFVISKLHTRAREERVRTYYMSRGLALRRGDRALSNRLWAATRRSLRWPPRSTFRPEKAPRHGRNSHQKPAPPPKAPEARQRAAPRRVRRPQVPASRACACACFGSALAISSC